MNSARGAEMDLLLTHGYFLDDDPKELPIMKPYPPLGILYLSSHLRARGFDVEIYDSTFGSRRELIGILEEGPPSVLGIGANLMTRGSVLEIVAAARARGLEGDCGWSGASQLRATNIWMPAPMWSSRVKRKSRWRNCCPRCARATSGVSTASASGGPDGAVVRTGAARLIPDLDAQPWPDRERIVIDRYLDVWREHHGTGSVSVITARGCPYHCPWCSHSTFGKTHRRRSRGIGGR